MIKKRLLTYKGDFIMGGMWEKDEVVRLLRGVPGTQYQEGDDQIKEQIRSWVRGLLTNSEVTVTFTKADGTDRLMKCTLEESKLPKVEIKEGAKTRKESTISMRVFDLEKNEWRSFTIKKVKQVNISIP